MTKNAQMAGQKKRPDAETAGVVAAKRRPARQASLAQDKYAAAFDAMAEAAMLFACGPSDTGQAGDIECIAANSAARAFFGSDTLAGHAIPDMLKPLEASIREDIRQALSSGHCTRRILASKSADRLLEMYLSPVEDTESHIVLAVFTQLATSDKEVAELLAREERLRALVSASSFAIFHINSDWSVMRQLNDAGQDGEGSVPAVDVFNRFVDPRDQQSVAKAAQDAIASRTALQVEHRMPRPDGSTGWAVFSATPILDDDGIVVEWIAAATDITERKRTEAAFRDLELRLRAAQSVAGVGTFDWEMGTNATQWSPELLNMFGLREGAFGGSFEDWVALIHPDDLPKAVKEIDWAIENGVLESEWRVNRPDGRTIWVLVRGVVERDSKGQATRLTGAQVDITERVQAEQRVRQLVGDLGDQITRLRRQLRKGGGI